MSVLHSRISSRLTNYNTVYFSLKNNLLKYRHHCTTKRKILKDEHPISKHIYQKIKAKGPITIADYMRDVLTNPAQGYYMSKDMLGAQGDFVTSPEISQMFGEMVAVWFLNEWHKMGSPIPLQIVELGPGRGTLSADILKVFSHFKALHQATLQLVEISPVLSEIQAKMLCLQSNSFSATKVGVYREGISHQGIPVNWYKQLKDVPDQFTLLIAHEFFDALPIHKFHRTYAGYREVLINNKPSEDDDEYKFRYVLSKNETPMTKVLIKPDESREHVEISPDSLLMYREICRRIKSNGGIGLICDYGHDGNGTDTFRAFKNHEQVDPLVMPGTADLTADVDFSSIRQMANEVGDIITLGPVTQRDFLLKVGIRQRFKSLVDSTKDKQQIENLTECYNFLIDENKMGERFKFMSVIPATLKRIIDRYPVVGFS